MGCTTSTPVVKLKPGSLPVDEKTLDNTKTKASNKKSESNKDKYPNGDLNKSIASTKENEEENLSEAVIPIKNQAPTVNVTDMSVKTQLSPVSETKENKDNVLPIVTNGHNTNDTNNNTNNKNSDAPSNEENDEVDEFDISSTPLSRDVMLGKRHKETEDTLNFVYKHASSTPLVGDNNLSSISPSTGGNRYANRRRPSGVPPPPRALLSSDPMARFGKKPLEFAEEEEEEEEEP